MQVSQRVSYDEAAITESLTATTASAHRVLRRWKNYSQFPTERLGPRHPLCEAAAPVGAVWHQMATLRPSLGSDRHNLFMHGRCKNKII